MNYPQSGWGPAPPPRPSRAPVFVLIGVIVTAFISCMVAGQVTRKNNEARRRAEANAQIQAAAWARQQQAPPTVPAVPMGACTRFAATNANNTPSERSLEADILDERLRNRGYRPGRVVFEPPASLVLTNMRRCNATIVRNTLAGDYTLPQYISTLCTAMGVHEVRCDTPTQRGAYVLDLEHGCQCSDRWTCQCPQP